MWSMLVLSLINAGLGFSVAVVLRARNRFVQKYVQRGYDLLRLYPPTFGKRLQRKLRGRVDVAKVLQRLTPANGAARPSISPPRGSDAADRMTGLPSDPGASSNDQPDMSVVHQRVGARVESGFLTMEPETDDRVGAEPSNQTAQWIDNARHPLSPLSLVTESGWDGVRSALQAWEKLTGPGEEKPASLMLIDVDQTTHWNEELGKEAFDQILSSCHRQLAESLRSNRGFDRVVRISGQQFLVFLGYTSAPAAAFAGERLRQVFANTTWRVADQTFVIHISGAIGDYHSATRLEPQIEFLRSALATAKCHGGNSFVVQTDRGSFQPIMGVPKYDLPPRHHDQPSEMWNPRALINCGGN